MDNRYYTNELPEKKCSSCSAMIDASDKICPYCGGVQMTSASTGSTGSDVRKFCKNCNELLSPGARFCPKCGMPENNGKRIIYKGHNTNAELKVCKNCNSVIDVKARICPECGCKQPINWGKFLMTGCLVYILIQIVLGLIAMLMFYIFAGGIPKYVEEEANYQAGHSIVQEAEQADCTFDFIE